MGKKKDTETIINEIKNIHGDKYDTSKVNYVNSKTKICLICHEKNILGEEHGEFWVVPSKITTRHDGCPKCSGHYQTTEEYIAKAELVHGNKYDHSKTVYEGSHKKLTVICPKHGEFQIIAKDHLNGQGCPKCKFEKIRDLKRDTQDSFLKKYYDKFKNDTIYDTSKVEYKKSNIKICLICHEKNILGEEHGEFWITPNLLLRGHKCPKCSGRYQTTEEFIAKAKLMHGDKYDYSKTEYIDAHAKVCIICPEHGEFWQMPYSHLLGNGGCPKCKYSIISNKLSSNTQEFIEKCKSLNKNDVDYSKVNYINNFTKVCLICHKKDKEGNEHGEFWQTPHNHLKGQGCPKCNSSHLENDMREFLTLNDINFIEQYNFNGLLKRQTVDFYLPDYNIAIECQGIQHFEPTYSKKNFEKSHKEFNKILKRDYKKYNKLIQLNLTVIYFIYKNIKKYIVNNDLFNNIYSINNVILDKNEILNKLKREE